jgi:hypothetical protein
MSAWCWTHRLYLAFYIASSLKQQSTSVVYRGSERRVGQTKQYELGIYRFSAKHATLMIKSKDWLARNQDNLFKWSDIFGSGVFFQ